MVESKIKIPKEKYIPLEKRVKVIDYLRLI